jgi:NitT/TauT family transport system substrate-binding protein
MKSDGTSDIDRTSIGRRDFLWAGLAALLSGAETKISAADVGRVRLGTLQFGTVQWVADVIRRNHLDTQYGFGLQTLTLANTEAGRIALMAGSTDVVVSDWTMVATQRAAGTRLSFAPFSSALGGIVVPENSIRALRDLKGRTLGVAGGPLDKSWLIVRAAGSAQGIDLASATRITYGAPPLLGAKLQQGELDAVLTYWNFVARLEAAGLHQALSVVDCAGDLGLPRHLGLLGFVFHEDWASRDRAAIDGFLGAATDAERRLADSDSEWQAVRPLMDAPEDALFLSLRRHFIDGIARPPADEEQRTAEQVLEILIKTGGTEATGGLSKLPDGVFWPVSNADK